MITGILAVISVKLGWTREFGLWPLATARTVIKNWTGASGSFGWARGFWLLRFVTTGIVLM